ncbi:kinesin 1 [Wallemia mellicola]|nr:kinesin 1 [Wallemia mellicola]
MASNNIKVVARFRPVNKVERNQYPPDGRPVIDISDTNDQVKLNNDDYSFDRVFNLDSKQEDVFEYGVRGIVDDVISGYNGTVFAYGQTGSGKTYTMMGSDIDDNNSKGIIPRITEQIFESILTSPPNMEYLVKVSYMEIYMERIRDLLSPSNDNLQVHEDKLRGVYVKNLSDYYVGDAKEVYEIMRQGSLARAVSSTNMNAESSRSHSIFLISIVQKNIETGSQKTGNLYLVDLAGSEKIGKTGATGQTLEEAKKINKSLSALGMVINALTDGKSTHIPYRDSKLTRILQESLGGNSRTTLIVNCSPSEYNVDETVSTLRFGMRAKSIKNSARVNTELSPAELKNLLKKSQRDRAIYEEFVNALEAELKLWRSGLTVPKEEWATKEPSAKENIPLNNLIPSSQSKPMIQNIDNTREEVRTNTIPTNLDKDEREDFLKYENELSDQLADKEKAVSSLERVLKELRDELEFYKSSHQSINEENSNFQTQLSDLRLQFERLEFDNKDNIINMDVLRDRNAELTASVNDLNKSLEEAKNAEKDSLAEDFEKKKAEKMAQMMAKFDATGFSEKNDTLRDVLSKLDEIDINENSDRSGLTSDDLSTIRRQLIEMQSLTRDSQDKLRASEQDNKALVSKREEVETRLHSLESEFEELLEKSIKEEEANNLDLQESINGIKEKLEAQYNTKREKVEIEVNDLRQQIEVKNHVVKTLKDEVKTLNGLNDELKRAFAVTSAGIEGGKNLVDSAKDLERTRKSLASQLNEFEGMKKSLMKDLQDRCEKVVELEIELDQYKEQYAQVLRSTNNKAAQKKMAFLERNLEQLTLVQKGLVDQNQSLKKEVAIAERKLLTRSERISNLEQLLQEADKRLVISNAKFEGQLQAVRERLEQARSQKASTTASINFGRIAKPLRGGGGSGSAGPSPTNKKTIDLSGIADNDDGSSTKRASWFFSAGK